jgi:hypothetical protein
MRTERGRRRHVSVAPRDTRPWSSLSVPTALPPDARLADRRRALESRAGEPRRAARSSLRGRRADALDEHVDRVDLDLRHAHDVGRDTLFAPAAPHPRPRTRASSTWTSIAIAASPAEISAASRAWLQTPRSASCMDGGARPLWPRCSEPSARSPNDKCSQLYRRLARSREGQRGPRLALVVRELARAAGSGSWGGDCGACVEKPTRRRCSGARFNLYPRRDGAAGTTRIVASRGRGCGCWDHTRAVALRCPRGSRPETRFG